MSSTLSLKMPPICSFLLLSLLFSITLLPIGCNAGGGTGLIGLGVAPGPVAALTKKKSQILTQGKSLNPTGKMHGSLGSSSFKMTQGAGSKSGRMVVAQTSGRPEAIVKDSASGFVKESKYKDSAADIEQKIIKEKIEMDVTKAIYVENGRLRNAEDRHSIQEVADVFKHMSEDLQNAKREYLVDASTAQIIYNQIKAFHKRHAHQVIDLLAIFALAFDKKFNAAKKVEKTIEIVGNAIEFYKHDVDPNAFDVTHAEQKSKVEDVDTKNKMNKLKEEMEAFKTWLKNVYEKIKVNPENGITPEEAQKHYLSIGNEIMEMLQTDGPFAKLGKFYSHLKVKETTGEKEVPNDKEYATAQSQHRNHHVHQQ